MVPTAKSGGRAAALQRVSAGRVLIPNPFSIGMEKGLTRFLVYDIDGDMTTCLLRDGAGGFTLTSRRASGPVGDSSMILGELIAQDAKL